MKKLYAIFLWILVFAGIAVSVYFGLQPKSVPKIKPSQVATPERMGEAIAQRLWLELKDTPVVFLGVDPDSPDDLKVWKGFFESLPPELKYTVVLAEPMLFYKALIPATEEIDIKNDYSVFVEGFKKAMSHNTRMAIVVPSIYSTQSLRDNPVYKLKGDLGVLPISISIARATLNREEEAAAPYPCVTGSGDRGGLGSWGCLIQAKSRSLYRKKWEPGQYVGLMDQIGAADYLVLLRYVVPPAGSPTQTSPTQAAPEAQPAETKPAEGK